MCILRMMPIGNDFIVRVKKEKKNIFINITISSVLKITITIILLFLLLNFTRVITNMIIVVTRNKLT
jgi:hypothetical protein